MTEERQDFIPEHRNKVLGMSEIGAVLGLSPYDTAADVFLLKTGRREPLGEPKPTGPTAPLYWGLKLERAIAEGVSDHLSRPVRKDGREYTKPEFRTVCHLDYRLAGEPVACEIKRPGSIWGGDWGEPWTDEVPEHYLAQVHGQMWHVPTLEYVLACRLVGHSLSIYKIERNPSWFELFERKIPEFWEYVDADEMPPVDYMHRNAKDTIETMYPGINEQVLHWDGHMEAKTELYDIAKKDRLDADKRVKSIQNEFRDAMGEAAFAIMPSGRTWRRQMQSRDERVQRAYDFIDLRCLKRAPAGIQ